jgi:hypothetical protein
MRFSRTALLLALMSWGAACRMPVRVDHAAGVAPHCDGKLCVEVVNFQSYQQHVGMWIDAPPGTHLMSARVAADAAPACLGQFPVKWVIVDRDLFMTGPVDISGAHGLVLEFPLNTWFGNSGYWREMFVDIQLDIAGVPRCVRTQLTRADGKGAAGL